jgi:uncharacterized protein YjbI with pentapeptide repeats
MSDPNVAPPETSGDAVRELKEQVRRLEAQVIEVDTRWLPVVWRIFRPETWVEPDKRDAALKALAYRILTPSAMVIGAGALAGMVASLAAVYQVYEMGEQTKTIKDTSEKQIAAMAAQTDLMRDGARVARITELMKILYDPDLAGQVRGMALRELLLLDGNIVQLDGANLADIKSPGANLSNKSLSNADLRRAHLNGANLEQADLSRARFSIDPAGSGCESDTVLMTSLAGSMLYKANMFYVDARCTILDDVFALGVQGFKADFSDSGVHRATLSFASFGLPSYVNGSGARCLAVGSAGKVPKQPLLHTSLESISSEGSTFAMADLKGVSLCWASFLNSNMVHANVKAANFEDANFHNTDASCAKGAGANFDRANLTSVAFRDAELEQTRWRGASFSDTDFTRADLRGADFTGAEANHDLYSGGLNLTGADLTGARGLTPQLLSHACGDKHSKLPGGIEFQLAACAPSLRPDRRCHRIASDGSPQSVAYLSDLVAELHRENPRYVAFAKAEAAERDMHLQEEPQSEDSIELKLDLPPAQ